MLRKVQACQTQRTAQHLVGHDKHTNKETNGTKPPSTPTARNLLVKSAERFSPRCNAVGIQSPVSVVPQPPLMRMIDELLNQTCPMPAVSADQIAAFRNEVIDRGVHQQAQP